jgi:hypothetical protein
MSKSGTKNYKKGRKSLAPLVGEIRKIVKNYKSSSILTPTTNKADRGPQSQALQFESMEPRILLSADPNPAALAINGSIDVPGEVDRYSFVLEQDTKVIFDSLTNNPSITWSLAGPSGAQATGRTLNNSDYSSSATNPLLALTAGEYTLTVDAVGDVTGEYGFRLIDLQMAQDVVPGTVVSNQLDPANETAVYRFGATAGERFYFDMKSVSASDVNWRLFDPYGKTVFGPKAITSEGEYTAAFNGSYLLLIEGSVGSTGVRDYSFNIQKITDDTKSLILGQSQGLEPQWVSGKLNGGLHLDGFQYGEITSNASIDLTQSLTLETWINVDRFADSFNPILEKSTGDLVTRTFGLFVTNSGAVSLATGNGVNQTVTTAGGLIGPNEWHHVAAVIDRDVGQMRIYVDGVERASGIVSTAAANSNSNPVLIGRSYSGNYNLEGKIDEVRLWNIARSVDDIVAFKDVELGGAEAGLVVYLNANDGSGSQLNDASSYGNHALIYNIFGPNTGVVAGSIDHVGVIITISR